MTATDQQPDQNADSTTSTPAPTVPNTITLDTPIQRGSTLITEVTLRKPNAGELRGLSLQRLLQVDAGELMQLLPRITMPSLTPPECQQMDPADLTEAGGIVSGFLLKKSVREALLQST
ncbi:phage tail assembly protein [uncultured Pseudacidovorax sp.]|uniref:phage tail assembly protein n=1 Tax=uncultured Pseudacidovorax sp. TaxID=679313 RepID=UPI0025FE2520|nr:phage tail assembly protein [uncultured Pseudacidovorax sp.]